MVLTCVICLLAGCGSSGQASRPAASGAGVIAPRDDSERAVLRSLDSLATGVRRTIGNITAVAEEPYHAASGRVCRWVRMSFGHRSPGTERRLACKQGKAWFFALDVLAAPVAQDVAAAPAAPDVEAAPVARDVGASPAALGVTAASAAPDVEPAAPDVGTSPAAPGVEAEPAAGEVSP